MTNMESESDKFFKKMGDLFAITILIFLFYNAKNTDSHSGISKRQIKSPAREQSNPACNGTDILQAHTDALQNETNFRYSVPQKSCIVCYNPNCTGECSRLAKSKPITLYNNLFEFGLFAFNLAEDNVFEIRVNEKCVFNMSVTPSEDFTNIRIVLNECEITGRSVSNCSQLYSREKTDVNPKRNCILISLAFFDPNKIHYAITFDCTYVPTALLSDNKSVDINSDDCHFDRDSYSPQVLYKYLDSRANLPSGVTIIMPCSPGGFAVSAQTGRFRSGEECEDFLREELKTSAFNYVIEKVYNNSQDLSFPKNRPNTSTMYPIYLNEDRSSKRRIEMEAVRSPIPGLEDKVLKGCNFVDSSMRQVITGPAIPTAPDPTGPPPPLLTMPENNQILLPTLNPFPELDDFVAANRFQTKTQEEEEETSTNSNSGMSAGDTSGGSLMTVCDFLQPPICFIHVAIILIHPSQLRFIFCYDEVIK